LVRNRRGTVHAFVKLRQKLFSPSWSGVHLMKPSAYFSKFLSAFLALVLLVPAFPSHAQSTEQIPAWEYNPGPDPSTEMGRKLIDWYAELPEFKAFANETMDKQKFRFIYGTMAFRARLEQNAVKVAFWGQDGTHVAEFAKHTATAGFGGRAQDFANYFGVDKSAAFSNAYLSTIYGQYGAFTHPIVKTDADGIPKITFGSYVEPQLWAMSNDPLSANTLSRNAYIEWMIKNNPESLRLLVLFGGAARDAMAEFLISRGAQVGTRLNPEQLKNIRMPQTKSVSGGGNNEFVVPVDKNGNDIYQELFKNDAELKQLYKGELLAQLELEKKKAATPGRDQDLHKYAVRDLQTAIKEFERNGEVKLDYKLEAMQKIAQKAMSLREAKAIEMMVFSKGGIEGSGIINPAQLGGYDLDKITINGENTRNLRGLRLSDGTVIERDILVTEMPHPSALSRLTPMDAAKRVGESLRALLPYKNKGWMVEPDAGWKNKWHDGEPYRYGRAEIRPGFYEFGTPGIRMVSVSSASRMSGKPHVISGTRDRVRFDDKAIDAATRAKPSQMPDPRELWTARPRLPESRYIFDRGPGEEVARMLKQQLNLKEIFQPKPGKTFAKDGIDAFNVKTAPEVLDFGHHRGSFVKPKVLILADPHGVDDLFTSRALTGARGQYLNGLMHDIGINEDYLVIKTVPFGMDGATPEEWDVTLKKTQTYREVAVALAEQGGGLQYIFADGENAVKEIERINNLVSFGKNVKIINIRRDGMDPASGIKEAGAELTKLEEFKGKKISGKMQDIPRSHLTWFSRIWEGTGGDRVLNAVDKNRGSAFASVVPEWVVRQKVTPSQWVQRSIDNLKAKFIESGVRGPRETMTEYVERTGIDGKKLVELLTDRVKTDAVKTDRAVDDLAAKRAAKRNNVSVPVTDNVSKPVSAPVSVKVAPNAGGACRANF
jgi:hypothetical protein